MWKGWLQDYFSFTRKERTGTLVLLGVVVVLTFLPFLLPILMKQEQVQPPNFQQELAALQLKQTTAAAGDRKEKSNDYNWYQTHERAEAEEAASANAVLFTFDPNTLEAAGWKKLGLRDKTIHTIHNYLSKGGKFYKPEDIRKIWGLTDAEKDRLEPYIRIASVAKATEPVSFNSAPATEKKPYAPTLVDINTADTSALIALPGIGSKLAQRIINFRDKLGGFYSINQVGETFGLPDSTFQKIKPRLALQSTTLARLNINTASLDHLKAHPYLRYAVANAIVQYRTQHGNFQSVTDIRKILAITEDVYSKAAPYLTVE